jgi:hypothetical protein
MHPRAVLEPWVLNKKFPQRSVDDINNIGVEKEIKKATFPCIEDSLAQYINQTYALLLKI